MLCSAKFLGTTQSIHLVGSTSQEFRRCGRNTRSAKFLGAIKPTSIAHHPGFRRGGSKTRPANDLGANKPYVPAFRERSRRGTIMRAPLPLNLNLLHAVILSGVTRRFCISTRSCGSSGHGVEESLPGAQNRQALYRGEGVQTKKKGASAPVFKISNFPKNPNPPA
jgi:hypothetical protein